MRNKHKQRKEESVENKRITSYLRKKDNMQKKKRKNQNAS